jgi:hypothetical protein
LLLGMDLGHRLHPGMALGKRFGQRGIKHQSGSSARKTHRSQRGELCQRGPVRASRNRSKNGKFSERSTRLPIAFAPLG